MSKKSLVLCVAIILVASTCILLYIATPKSVQPIQQEKPSVEEVQTTEDDAVGLYGESFEFLHQTFIKQWDSMLTIIEFYCTEHDIDINTLYCSEHDLSFTDNYEPYVDITYDGGNLRLLFDDSKDPVTVTVLTPDEY